MRTAESAQTIGMIWPRTGVSELSGLFREAQLALIFKGEQVIQSISVFNRLLFLYEERN